MTSDTNLQLVGNRRSLPGSVAFWLLGGLLAVSVPSAASEVEFVSHNFDFQEGARDPTVSVRLVNCPARQPRGSVPVRVVASGETAEEGTDFFAFGSFELGEAAIGAGGELRVVRVAEVPIEVVSDDLGEAAESFTLRIEVAPGAVLDCGNGPEPVVVGDVASVTIVDAPIDRSTVGFATGDVRIVEGDGDPPRVARFKVERRGGVLPASVICQTTRAGTAVEGEDFEPVGVVLGWGEGDTSPRFCDVPILGDDITEPRETVAVLLVPAGGEVDLQGDRGTVHVSDDDSPGRLQFRSVEFLASEGEEQAVVTVERRGGSEGPARVLVRAYPRSAQRGVDWSLDVDSLEWEDGEEQPKQLIIDLVDDSEEEVTESLTLVLEAGSEASLLGDLKNAVVTIADDDGVEQASTVTSGPSESDLAEPPLGQADPDPEPEREPEEESQREAPFEIADGSAESPLQAEAPQPAAMPEEASAPAPSADAPQPNAEQLLGNAEPLPKTEEAPPVELPAVTVQALPIRWRGSKLEAGVKLTNHDPYPVALRVRLSVSRNLEPAARAEGRVTLEPGETVTMSHPFSGLPRGDAYTLSYRTSPEPGPGR